MPSPSRRVFVADARESAQADRRTVHTYENSRGRVETREAQYALSPLSAVNAMPP